MSACILHLPSPFHLLCMRCVSCRQPKRQRAAAPAAAKTSWQMHRWLLQRPPAAGASRTAAGACWPACLRWRALSFWQSGATEACWPPLHWALHRSVLGADIMVWVALFLCLNHLRFCGSAMRHGGMPGLKHCRDFATLGGFHQRRTCLGQPASAMHE